jgi:hypothetical protein
MLHIKSYHPGTWDKKVVKPLRVTLCTVTRNTG